MIKIKQKRIDILKIAATHTFGSNKIGGKGAKKPLKVLPKV